MAELGYLQDLSDADLAQLYVDAGELLRRRVGEEGEMPATSIWSVPVFQAALEVFGPNVYGEGRTRKALNGRITHALRVWNEKYGPLTPSQEAYADAVLSSAIRSAGDWAKREGFQPQPAVYAKLADVVNHERVHQGFQNRSGAVRRDLDVSGAVREAA